MKAYCYFLFRVYKFYTDKIGESENQALFSANAVSTIIIFFIVLSIYGLANYFSIIPMFKNKMYVIPFMIAIGIINYFFFVRSKKFLSYDFQKDRHGGWLIVVFIVVLGGAFITLSNVNRKKVFEERKKKPQIEQTEKRESLEGKIRKWFNE